MSVSNLNILFTSAHFPYPLIGGDRIKQYHVLKHLSERNNIFVVAFDRWYPIKDEYKNELAKLGIKSCGIELNIPKSYLMGAVFSPFGHPLEIEFFRDGRFKKAVREIVNNNRIDLAMNYFLRTTEYLVDLPCKKFLMAEDCRSFYQGRTYNQSSNLRQKLIRKYESIKLKKYEAEISSLFDVTTLVSEEDRNEMKKLNPDGNIRILTNGVNTEIFKPSDLPVKRKDIIFVAKLDGWVNNLMLDRLIRSIMPEILNSQPDAVLHIVGANPQKKHFQLQNSNVVLHPDVPDIVPYLQNSAVFIHPHVGGSGIQNKVLEAMSCGCPVITTKSGARGINITSGQEGFILENDKDIAETAIELLNNENLVKSVELNSRNFILRNHKWEFIYDELDKLIDEIMC